MRIRRQQVRGNIVFLPVEDIMPNPVQPRKHFEKEALEQLAASISEHGILSPLNVRPRNGKYELIAGERRLRASVIAGLSEVPCIILNVNLEESSMIALVENLQRKDLDVIEEAEGIARLIRMFGLSQDETARRLGKSQSAIANKLRLLRLPSDVLERIRGECLSERHGRALLRLNNAEAQRAALEYIIDQKLNVAATESFIEYLMTAPLDEMSVEAEDLSVDEAADETVSPETGSPAETVDAAPHVAATSIDIAASEGSAASAADSTELPEPEVQAVGELRQTARKGRTLYVLKDVRIFLNSLARGLSVMKQGGIDIGLDKRETDTDLILTINIPKPKRPQS